MPNNYPETDELADSLLPFRYQIKTMDDARLLVTRYYGTPADFGYVMHDNTAEALYKRRGMVPE